MCRIGGSSNRANKATDNRVGNMVALSSFLKVEASRS